MLFAQTCDSTFEVGLSKTMSVPSKYIPFFLIYANIFPFYGNYFMEKIISHPFLPTNGASPAPFVSFTLSFFHSFILYNLAPVTLYVSPFRMISNCPSRSTFVLRTSSLVSSIPSCGSGSVPGSGVGCADTITVTGITSSIANSVFESAL